MRLLITGGCGFLGSNLAADALHRGEEVLIFDNLSRTGASANLAWLTGLGELRFIHGDIRNANDVRRTVADFRPGAVFHLAGQVAMTTSIADPRRDFETNALGTFNVLEALRTCCPEAMLIYSSTNKVYGDLEQFAYRETETRYECIEHPLGFDESVPLDFHSPYGCSKGAAEQYVLDYKRMFGLRTVVFRHSSMYGGRQFATVDQGWIGWFCAQALRVQAGVIPPVLQISGNGKQVRDVLHADDMSRLYVNAVAGIDRAAGQVFNIGGGIDKSLSLLELFAMLKDLLGVEFALDKLEARQSDQKVFVANPAKASALLGWHPEVDARTGVSRMLAWVRDSQGDEEQRR